MSGPATGAWEGRRLVGFIRALSDGRLSASVEDALIDDRYRDQGLGRALWQRLRSEHRTELAVREGRLRVSPHFYNSEEQIDRLVNHLPTR